MRTRIFTAGMLVLPAILFAAEPPIFGPPIDYNPFIGSAPQLAQSDIDGDGDLDIVLSSYSDSKVSWLENIDPVNHVYVRNDITAIGSTVGGPTEIAVGDFTGSRGPDVVAIDSLGDPVGFYRAADVRQPWNRASISSPFGLNVPLLGSFVDGAKQQILLYDINSATSGLTILDVTSTSPFTTVPLVTRLSTSAKALRAIAAVDWNHDGHLDLLAIERTNAAGNPYDLHLLAGAGDGINFTESTLAQNVPSPLGIIPGSNGGSINYSILSAGDWTGDGNPEAAYVTASGVELIQRTGPRDQDIAFVPLGGLGYSTSNGNNPPGARKLFAVDYDRDGRLDLVQACTDRINVFVQSFGSFLSPTTIASGQDYSEALLDNFSQSGNVDIVHGAPGSSGYRVRLEPGIVGTVVRTLAASLDNGQVLQPGARGHLQTSILNSYNGQAAVTVSLHSGGGVALASGSNVIFSGYLNGGQQLDLNLPFRVLETIRAPAAVTVALDVVADAPVGPPAVSLGTWGTADTVDTHFYGVNGGGGAVPDPGTRAIAFPTTPLEGTITRITLNQMLNNPSDSDFSGEIVADNGVHVPVFSQGDVPRSGPVTWTFIISTPFQSGPAVLLITDNVPGNAGVAGQNQFDGYIRRYLGPMTPAVSQIRRALNVPVTIVDGDENGDGVYDAGDVVAAQNAAKKK